MRDLDITGEKERLEWNENGMGEAEVERAGCED